MDASIAPPVTAASASRGIATRMRDTLALPDEPNSRRASVIQRTVALVAGGLPTADVITAGLGDLVLHPMIHVVTGAIAVGCGMFVLLSQTQGELTSRLSYAHRMSLRSVMDGLRDACANGLEEPDREDLQGRIDLLSEAFETAFGRSPWLIVAEAHPDARRPIPSSLAEMAIQLSGRDEVIAWIEDRNGVARNLIEPRLASIIPLIVAIGNEFGLDMRGLEPPPRNLPGLRPAFGQAEPEPALPASRARDLARKWLDGDRSKVDDLTRIEADAAAGRDLRQLEEAWTAARLAAPERHAEIDATYDAAIERISNTLSTAIDVRARIAIDRLDTHGRYLASKSPVDAFDRQTA